MPVKSVTVHSLITVYVHIGLLYVVIFSENFSFDHYHRQCGGEQ